MSEAELIEIENAIRRLRNSAMMCGEYSIYVDPDALYHVCAAAELLVEKVRKFAAT